MNKGNFFLLVFFLLASIFIGCKKKPFDYRTKYIGNYDFVNTWTSYNMAATPPTNSGTTNSSGRIEYEKEDMIKLILDANLPDQYQILSIDKEGNLSLGSVATGKCETKKSLHYQYSVNGLGGGGTTNVSGKKK